MVRSDRRRGDSESDSDASEGRSLELASSHSSDGDESTSTNRRHRIRNAGVSTVGYLPNITEHVLSQCGTPPALNIVTNSQLFPNIQQPYAGRWSNQLPEAYLPNTN
ncbi:starry night, partial [Carabus blaptoides fortunei]